MYKRINEIRMRKDEIRSILETGKEFDDKAISDELETLNKEERSMVTKMELIGKTQSTALKPIEERSIIVSPDEAAATARATKEYRTAFYRLLQRGNHALTNEEKGVLQTVNPELRFDSGSSGGAAIPQITLDMVIQKMLIISAVYPFVSKHNVKGNLKIPYEGTTADASWNAEGNPLSPSADTITDLLLSQYQLMKTVKVSRMLEQLSIDAFETFIVDKLFKKMMVAIENAILNGVGTTQPLGILNAVSWTGANSLTYTSLSTMTYDLFTSLKALLLAPYHPGATFVVNPNTLYNGIAAIKDALGRPIFLDNPQYGLTSVNGGEQTNYQASAVVGRILGNPVVMTPYLADGIILLGDLDYYHFNMSRDVLIEKSYEFGFTSNDVYYKAWLLGDGGVSLSEAFVQAYIA